MNNIDSMHSKQKKGLWISLLVVMLIFPIAYLVYKTKDVERPKEKEVAVKSVVGLVELEDLVKTNPTFDNLINLSMAYINNQMPGKSVAFLKQAIVLDPKNAVAYNNLGVAYTMLEQYQNGIDACSKAIQIDSEFQLAKNNLNWAMDERAKVVEAIKLQEQTTDKNIDFYIEHGLNYFKIGVYDKSIELWSEALKLDANNTKALNNIGTAFMMKYQYDDAISIYRKVIELEPNNELANNNLLWALDEKQKNTK